jgi:hypothetical protein
LLIITFGAYLSLTLNPRARLNLQRGLIRLAIVLPNFEDEKRLKIRRGNTHLNYTATNQSTLADRTPIVDNPLLTPRLSIVRLID